MIVNYNKYIDILKLNENINTDVRDKEALNKVRAAFMQIITNLAYFADLLFKLNIIEADQSSGINTMATDGKSIVYSPEFVNSLSTQEVVFVIIHEIMHNANFHFARQEGRIHNIWNYAADYAINILINDLAEDLSKIPSKTPCLKKPQNILLDEEYRDMSAEKIYDILIKKQPEQPKPGQGQPGQGQPGQGQPGQGQPGQGQPGQGQPGQPKPGQTGPDGDIRKPGSLDKAGRVVSEGSIGIDENISTKELEKAWEIAVKSASSKNIGTGSARMDRYISKINKPKINWKVELYRFISEVLSDIDYSGWNKKYIHRGQYIHGLSNVESNNFKNAVIAIDTSGSITDDTLSKFSSELRGIFDEFEIENCYVIWCDSEIKTDGGVQLFSPVDSSFKIEKKFKPVGGGGTSFIPPFQWIKQNLINKGDDPTIMLYFTDAFGDAPNPNQYDISSYQDRVMWVITDNEPNNSYVKNIKFGKKLFIDKNVD